MVNHFEHSLSEEKEIEILEGSRVPKNEPELQMILAEELFKRDHVDAFVDNEDLSKRNEITQYWIDSGYAKKFRDLVGSDEFKSSGKDILTLELGDVAKVE